MKRCRYPRVGDYVLVSKYLDRSPFDAWHVGFISKVEQLPTGQILYSVVGGNRSYFNYCWHITPGEGNLIIEFLDPRAAKYNKKPARPYRKPRKGGELE